MDVALKPSGIAPMSPARCEKLASVWRWECERVVR